MKCISNVTKLYLRIGYIWVNKQYMKYIRKSKEIEAVQWLGNNFDDIYSFTQGSCEIHNQELLVDTLEGKLTASYGDYIIYGYTEELGNHWWPVKPSYFDENYSEFRPKSAEEILLPEWNKWKSNKMSFYQIALKAMEEYANQFKKLNTYEKNS